MRRIRNLFETKFEHLFLTDDFRRLMQSCMSKTSSRYGIDRLFVHKNVFCVTNGRQLFELEVKHKYQNGLYFVTKDGFCLIDTESAKFPKYTEVIPNSDTLEIIWSRKKDFLPYERAVELIIFELNQKKCFFNLHWLDTVVTLLQKLDAYNVTLSVNKEDSRFRPFVMQGEISHQLINKEKQQAKFTYLQMPVNKT